MAGHYQLKLDILEITKLYLTSVGVTKNDVLRKLLLGQSPVSTLDAISVTDVKDLRNYSQQNPFVKGSQSWLRDWSSPHWVTF